MGKAFEALKENCANKADELSKYCEETQREVLDRLDVVLRDYRNYFKMRRLIASHEADKYAEAKNEIEEKCELHKNAVKALDEAVGVYSSSADKSKFACKVKRNLLRKSISV